MSDNSIFDNAYPFILTGDENTGLSLEDVQIPPTNIVARLNDQWVKEIGLDVDKFGYGHSFRFLLAKKIGDSVEKKNLIEKIRILQTIGAVFSKLNEEGQKQVIEFIQKEPSVYPNLRGSRDQTFFNHRKQLTVVVLEIITDVKDLELQNSLLSLLFEILTDNFEIVTKKTYFDEYNSYTYSEEQRQIAGTIVQGIEKKLLSLVSEFVKESQLLILRKLWSLPILTEDLVFKRDIVRKIHIPHNNYTLDDLKELIRELKEISAPELEIVKGIIMELNLSSNETDTKEIIDFYSKDFSDSENSGNLKLLTQSIKKIFNDAKTEEEKENLIKLLFTNDDKDLAKHSGATSSKVLPLIGLFLEHLEAQKIIFKILLTGEYSGIHYDIRNKLSSKYFVLEQFIQKFSELLINDFRDKDLDISIDLDLVDNFIEILKNELIDEETGESLIDLLLKRRDRCRFSDFLLQKTFQKAHDSLLGRYLQYVLLVRM
jgi:hypothetical protein